MEGQEQSATNLLVFPNVVHHTTVTNDTSFLCCHLSCEKKEGLEKKRFIVRKQQTCKRQCNYFDCTTLYSDNNVKFKHISPPVKLTCGTNNREIEQYAIKNKYRVLCLLRMADDQKDIRICNMHKTTNENVSVQWTTSKGEGKTTRKQMNLPAESSTEAILSSSGNGVHCNIQQQISVATEKGDTKAALSLMLLWSCNDDVASLSLCSNQTHLGVDQSKDKNKKNEQQVVVRLLDLNNQVVKVQTGFPSLLAMLAFVAVVCHGRLKEVKKKTRLAASTRYVYRRVSRYRTIRSTRYC
jgi:hypothetical protein